MDPDDLTAQIADRRADPDFQARLQERTTQDKPILDRLAALKTVSPEQLAEAIQQAGPSFTFVRAMSGGRLEMTTDRVTADGDPITIYASTAVTGEWHVDDGAETYHRLLRAGFDINAPGTLDIFHNSLYRYRLHRVGSTVFARAPEDEPIQVLCRRFTDALVALDGLRLLTEVPAGASQPAPLSPELRTRLVDAVERPLRIRAAILKLAGRACGHLAEPPGGCCAGCPTWPCETTFQTAQPALAAFADYEHAPLHEIRANERRRLLQQVQAMSPGEMDGWAFRDQMLALLRSPG